MRNARQEHMDSALEKQRVGERLRLAREALGVKQAEFARRHGIDKTKLSHWERGQHLPSLAYVRLLWREYQISADWIYLGLRGRLPADVAENLPKVGVDTEGA